MAITLQTWYLLGEYLKKTGRMCQRSGLSKVFNHYYMSIQPGMRRDFMMRYAKCTKMKHAVMRNMYQYLTNDKSSANTAREDAQDVQYAQDVQ